MDKVFGIILSVFVVAACVALMGLFYFMWHAYTSEEIELIKESWVCSESEDRRSLIMAGKVPVMTTKEVCMKYERIGE